MPECENCGAYVTKQYVRVFKPEHVDDPRACPECEDMLRKNGKPIPARSARHAGNAENDGSGKTEIAKHGEAGWSR